MAYQFLAAELWPLADELVGYYVAQWGIAAGKVRKEEALPGADLGLRPTLHAPSRDHHIICVEVASSPYFDALDSFVLACRNEGAPVRIYVAVPETTSGSSFQADLRRARGNGVGVLEVSPQGVQIVAEALSLSLTDVRSPESKKFPPQIRPHVTLALQTFRGGDPSKGCANVYDEIEALTRKLAATASKKKAWRRLDKGQADPNFGDVNKAPWSTLAQALLRHLDPKKFGRPRLTEALLGRILGITSHRNEAGHKPKNRSALQKRDRKLRTRFEDACDLLEEFASAMRRK
jgi:hypothetical protein